MQFAGTQHLSPAGAEFRVLKVGRDDRGEGEWTVGGDGRVNTSPGVTACSTCHVCVSVVGVDVTLVIVPAACLTPAVLRPGTADMADLG